MSNSAFDKHIQDVISNPDKYDQLTRDLAGSVVERDKKVAELEGLVEAMTLTLRHMTLNYEALTVKVDDTEKRLRQTETNHCTVSGRSARLERAIARLIMAMRRQKISAPPIDDLTDEDRDLVWVHVKWMEREAEQHA